MSFDGLDDIAYQAYAQVLGWTSGVSPLPLALGVLALMGVVFKLPTKNLVAQLFQWLTILALLPVVALSVWLAVGEWGHDRYKTWVRSDSAGLRAGQSFDQVLLELRRLAVVRPGPDGPIVRFVLEPAGPAALRPPQLQERFAFECKFEGGRLAEVALVDPNG